MRRTRLPPEDVEAARARYDPDGLRVFKGEPWSLHYRIGGFQRIDEYTDEGNVSYRSTDGWMHDGSGVVGYICLRDYKINDFLVDDSLFWDAMDGYSYEASQLAQAFLSGWAVEDVFGYGNLIEFVRLWVSPRHAYKSLWAPLINRFLDHRYGRRSRGQGSLLLLKPFPLEYEGLPKELRASDAALQFRTAAMMRLYERKLGVRRLHSDEWMWKTFRGAVQGTTKTEWKLAPQSWTT